MAGAAGAAAQGEIDYQYRCFSCDRTYDGKGLFSLHFRRVFHEPPLRCGQDRCENTFQQLKSLLRHIRDIHIPQAVGANNNAEVINQGHQDRDNLQDQGNLEDRENLPGQDNLEDGDNLQNRGDQDGVNRGNNEREADEEGALLLNHNIDLTRSAATMVLNLRQSAMTSASIMRIQDECYGMMQDTSNSIKIKVMNFLQNENIQTPASRDLLREISIPNPFLPIRTMKQQLAYFAREMGLVVPVPCFLDWRPDFRLNPVTNQYEPTQVPMTFQYIPIIETIKLILSNPKFRELIDAEQPSDDGVLRSYLDGSRSKLNDLLQRFPKTLRIQLNWDDLEVVNPLGSKTSIHKLAAFYFSLQNFPPVENSQLSTIYLLALAYSEDIKQMRGFDKVLEPFLTDLKKLESDEGVLIKVGDEEQRVHATLTLLAADTLAAHDILGFLAPSARHFCRWCMVSRQELRLNCLARGERRTMESFSAHVNEVRNRPAFSLQCGVKRDCPLREAKFFDVTQDAPFDIFHDLLEGVCHLVIILALYQFTVVDKFFTLKEFNARVAAFNYGVPDQKNKPSVNMTEEKLRNKKTRKFNQSGIQMWCLTRVFGFLVPEVPEDHPHLRLVNYLQQIVLTAFSREVRPADNLNLGDLITSHHTLFQRLFIDVAELDEDEEEEEEEEIVDDPGQPGAPPVPRANVFDVAPARMVKPINKLHHMTHLMEQIEKHGPPILCWCARYEGRHHIFCKYAAVCCNFINLPKSMAQMHQISTLCGVLRNAYRAEDMEPHSSVELAVRETEHSAMFLANGLDEDTIVCSVKSIVIAGEDYRPGLFVIADTSPCFAVIQHVYVHNDEVYFVLLKWETLNFVRRYCAYQIRANPAAEPTLVRHKALGKHGSFAPWNPFNQRSTFISPRFLIF